MRPQISPLRCAPVPRHGGAGEMTILFEIELRDSGRGPWNCRSLDFARDDKGKGVPFSWKVVTGHKVFFKFNLDRPESSVVPAGSNQQLLVLPHALQAAVLSIIYGLTSKKPPQDPEQC
jgi:hypothetical protein